MFKIQSKIIIMKTLAPLLIAIAPFLFMMTVNWKEFLIQQLDMSDFLIASIVVGRELITSATILFYLWTGRLVKSNWEWGIIFAASTGAFFGLGLSFMFHNNVCWLLSFGITGLARGLITVWTIQRIQYVAKNPDLSIESKDVVQLLTYTSTFECISGIMIAILSALMTITFTSIEPEYILFIMGVFLPMIWLMTIIFERFKFESEYPLNVETISIRLSPDWHHIIINFFGRLPQIWLISGFSEWLPTLLARQYNISIFEAAIAEHYCVCSCSNMYRAFAYTFSN